MLGIAAAKRGKVEEQQKSMFESETDDGKEKYVQGSKEGRNRQNEFLLREDGKTVLWGSAGVAGFSGLS